MNIFNNFFGLLKSFKSSSIINTLGLTVATTVPGIEKHCFAALWGGRTFGIDKSKSYGFIENRIKTV